MDKPGNRFCFYTHSRPDTGAVFYVGIGLGYRPKKRSDRNYHWHNIVNKNGGKFIIDVYCEHETWESVCQMEIALIKFYGREDNGTGILTNMTDGGDGRGGAFGYPSWIKGKKMCDETRKKISAALKITMSCPEYRKRQSARMMGHPTSDETKEKLRIAHTGRVIPLEARAKMSASAMGKVISVEARRKIREARLGTKQSREHVRNTQIANFVNRGWVIDQVCPVTDKVVNTFLTTYLASAATNAGRTCITTVMNGHQKTAGGYVWRRNYDKEVVARLAQEYIPALKIEAA